MINSNINYMFVTLFLAVSLFVLCAFSEKAHASTTTAYVKHEYAVVYPKDSFDIMGDIDQTNIDLKTEDRGGETAQVFSPTKLNQWFFKIRLLSKKTIGSYCTLSIGIMAPSIPVNEINPRAVQWYRNYQPLDGCDGVHLHSRRMD